MFQVYFSTVASDTDAYISVCNFVSEGRSSYLLSGNMIILRAG